MTDQPDVKTHPPTLAARELGLVWARSVFVLTLQSEWLKGDVVHHVTDVGAFILEGRLDLPAAEATAKSFVQAIQKWSLEDGCDCGVCLETRSRLARILAIFSEGDRKIEGAH